MSARLLLLPTRDCRDCAHARPACAGTLCTVYEELILAEALTAPDCPAYEPEPDCGP